MCGIALVFSAHVPTEVRQVEIFQELLYITALRGVHGTGVFSRNGFAKEGVLPAEFINKNKDYENLKKQYIAAPAGTGDFLVGHCRQATKGVVCSQNTHPFQHNNITLVHNGTLRRQDLLPDHSRFEVDSDNIAYSLATTGTVETLANLAGAFALVWHDASDDTLHLIKNSERPFFLQKVSSGVIYGASESQMLHMILDRRKTPYEASKGFELENEREYIFQPDGEWQMIYRRKCYRYTTPAANTYNTYRYSSTSSSTSATRTNTAATAAGGTTGTTLALALAEKTTAPTVELKPAPALIEAGYSDFRIGSEIEFVITRFFKTSPSNSTVEAYWLGKYEDVRIYSPAWYSTADDTKVYKGRIMTAYFVTSSDSQKGKELLILLQPESCKPVRAITLWDEEAFEAFKEGVSCEETEDYPLDMALDDALIGTCSWCTADIFQSDLDSGEAEAVDGDLETLFCSACVDLYKP